MAGYLKTSAAVAVPGSVAAGAATDVTNYVFHKSIVVTGTFVLTTQLQGSMDGTNWANLGPAITAPICLEIAGGYNFIRANTTAFTSGAAVATVAGYRSVQENKVVTV